MFLWVCSFSYQNFRKINDWDCVIVEEHYPNRIVQINRCSSGFLFLYLNIRMCKNFFLSFSLRFSPRSIVNHQSRMNPCKAYALYYSFSWHCLACYRMYLYRSFVHSWLSRSELDFPSSWIRCPCNVLPARERRRKSNKLCTNFIDRKREVDFFQETG